MFFFCKFGLGSADIKFKIPTGFPRKLCFDHLIENVDQLRGTVINLRRVPLMLRLVAKCEANDKKVGDRWAQTAVNTHTHSNMNGVHNLWQKRPRFASILSHSPTGANASRRAAIERARSQKNKVGSPRVWLCQPRGFLLWVATCSACESVFRRPPVDQHLFYFQTIYSLAARAFYYDCCCFQEHAKATNNLSWMGWYRAAAEMRLPVHKIIYDCPLFQERDTKLSDLRIRRYRLDLLRSFLGIASLFQAS